MMTQGIYDYTLPLFSSNWDAELYLSPKRWALDLHNTSYTFLYNFP